ncbi:MAG: PAS domain S-box protein, partial [Burkholderiaceae bacterium]|nr:PAS domain S-box protein [Burkholderiaceae bacterium]
MNTSETVSPIERSVRAELEPARLQKALRDSEQRYQALFNSIDEGFCVIEMLFDANGRPDDYRFIEINRLFEEQTGLVHPLGRTARELVPDLEQRWFELYGEVALTGRPARFIERSDKMGRWFEVHAFRVVAGPAPQVAIRFRDITDRRRAEAALHESRRRLQTAMDAARMYSWEMDLATQQVEWSSNHKDVLGFSLPANFQDAVHLLHPDDRGPTTRAVLRAIESSEPCLGEFRIINPDNREIVWGAWQGVAVGEAADGHRRFVGITQNITARKHAEKALLASNARLQMLVSQSAAGIVEADLQGRFTFVNRRFCQITGHSESELLQLRVHDLTHPDDRSKSAELFNQLAAGGADYDLEKRYVRKDGAAVWVSNNVSGMRDAEGRVRSLMAVSIDVTARRAAERGQLEADARKDEFLAILAHELRSPLAPIRNSAQIMQLIEPR